MLSEPNTNNTELIQTKPKYLWFLMTSYSMAIFAANWFDPRHVNIFGLCTGAGSIAFPLTYLFADTITEVYGYKNTRLAIWAGLIFYAICLFYGQFVIHFLDPHSSYKNALDLFLGINNHIIVATLASLLVAESINSYLVAKLKILFRGKYIGFRFLISTLTAYFFDEIFYAPIAFFGLMNLKNFLHHMMDSWIFMVSIEILLLPLSVRIAKHIKAIEKSDIYDTKTNFNIFNLDARYSKEDNKYKCN